MLLLLWPGLVSSSAASESDPESLLLLLLLSRIFFFFLSFLEVFLPASRQSSGGGISSVFVHCVRGVHNRRGGRGSVG